MSHDFNIDSTQILAADEITAVLEELHRRAKRTESTRVALVVFRLSACAGLRASEIAGLNIEDVKSSLVRPYIDVRAAIAKYNRHRRVPLTWDDDTREDLDRWKLRRIQSGAAGSDPFVCSVDARSRGHRLTRHQVFRRWKRALKTALPAERVKDLPCHGGRHTFISHAIHYGFPLDNVRRAAGHTSLATTSIYSHVVADNATGDLFKRRRLNEAS